MKIFNNMKHLVLPALGGYTYAQSSNLLYYQRATKHKPLVVSKAEQWRLFVDGELQRKENGFLGVESREHGYIEAMKSGYEYAMSSQEKVDLELITEIHRRATSGLDIGVYRGRSYSQEFCYNSGKIRDEKGVGLRLHIGVNATVEGLAEIEKELHTGMRDFYQFDFLYDGLKYNPLPRERLIQQGLEFIQEYNQKNKKSILDIVTFISQLERLHLFDDGNTRTLLLLLNRELKQNGFSQVILDDPNRFDGFSKQQMVLEVEKGITNYKLVAQGVTSHLGLTTKEILKIKEENPNYVPQTIVFPKNTFVEEVRKIKNNF